MSGREPPSGIDSRGWTGPEPAPLFSRRDRQILFHEAGGPATRAPRRAVAATSWAGLPVILLLVLAAADNRARWLGLGPSAAALRAHLESWLVPPLGFKDAQAWVDLLGNAQFSAALLALLAAGIGTVVACWHRAALRRGDAAVAARWPGEGRAYGLFVLPLLILLSGRNIPSSDLLHFLSAPALWGAAWWMAAAMTESAERAVAGVVPGRGWHVAELVAATGALLLVLLYAMTAPG